MAFLDNSGDIILDAVLTDTGRLRLAQGDGSFKITKFALGDDEINYGNYNNSHASGSAYYDLEILQTPVLEAFTNNTSNLNTKLMSIARTNILYMPELLLNKRTKAGVGSQWQTLDSYMYIRTGSSDTSSMTQNYGAEGGTGIKYVVAVDDTTWNILNYGITGQVGNLMGAIQGYTVASGLNGGIIRVDQGLNTNQINAAAGIDSDLLETQYIIELDYRLGRVKNPTANSVTSVNFIDDDNIASYYMSGTPYVENNTNTNTLAEGLEANTYSPQVFAGPRGTSLQFRIQASTELQYSTYLFTQLGQALGSNATTGYEAQLGFSSADIVGGGGGLTAAAKAYVLDTTVRVIGANTGYRMDIPIRYLKIE